MVSITAMGKWLLACLHMAISARTTQVCHGIVLVDVALFLRNWRRISTRCVYDGEFNVMYRHEPKTQMWARVAQLVEDQTCKQGIVGSIQALAEWLFRHIDFCNLLIVDVQDGLIQTIYIKIYNERLGQIQHMYPFKFCHSQLYLSITTVLAHIHQV